MTPFQIDHLPTLLDLADLEQSELEALAREALLVRRQCRLFAAARDDLAAHHQQVIGEWLTPGQKLVGRRCHISLHPSPIAR